MLSPLQTERLTLLPLSPAALALYPAAPARLEIELGCALSRAVMTDVVRRAIGMKLAKLAGAPPAHCAWYTYWLLEVRAENFGAGLAGFKGFPDARGEAEIGYGIDPAYQGRGYTTEAARALVGWAFEEPACLAVTARGVQPANIASQRVLAKVGMTLVSADAGGQNWRIARPAT